MIKRRLRTIIYKKWKSPQRREQALLKCWEIRKKLEDLSGWKISERLMKKNAKTGCKATKKGLKPLNQTYAIYNGINYS